FPEFRFDFSVKQTGTRSFLRSGGLTATGGKAYLNVQGTDYVVPQSLYDEFTATYAQLQSQGGSQGQGLLGSLGINPVNWLTDLKNEGTSDVNGTKTIHISGTADAPKLVADLKRVARRAGGSANGSTNQLDRLNNSVQSASLDVYTGE